jgi:2-polyprenyl-6-methoxyphenol hydroxylase-like FAD-dependent oxidoreductase
VAECDEATWFHCGLDTMTDDARKALAEQIFAPELGCELLIASNSIWRQFPVIRNQRWSHGKCVLMGDALASAHFSIGSGTRIAMEDAIALADAILRHSDSVGAITSTYEQTRRPGKDRLIDASENSFNWYEDIAAKMAAGNVHAFVYDFMTRTGRVDAERLVQQFPELVAAMRQKNIKVAA